MLCLLLSNRLFGLAAEKLHKCVAISVFGHLLIFFNVCLVSLFEIFGAWIMAFLSVVRTGKSLIHSS